MNKVEVETVVRLHTPDAVLEVGTDADTGSCVEIRTPDARSREWYGDIRLALPSEVALTLTTSVACAAGRCLLIPDGNVTTAATTTCRTIPNRKGRMATDQLRHRRKCR